MSATDALESRYEGLRAYLAGLPDDQAGVELRFSEIEVLIGGPLPPEASEWDWWRIDDGGTPSPQSRSWVQAGFGISAIAGLPDRSGWVSFVRGMHRWPGLGVASSEFGQLPATERLHQLALGYLESGKLMCVHLGDHPAEMTWPRGSVVCFCYRHAVELFLKACILRREPIEKCDHDIGKLRKQYDRLYSRAEFDFRTLYDLSLEDIEEALGERAGIEDFERKPDQVFRYLADKQGRSPRGHYMFAPGMYLSMLEQLEKDIQRIWGRIR